MQGGGGDPFNFDFPFGGLGGSFGGSGGPNNGPRSLMSNVFGGDSIDGFGRSDGDPPCQMFNDLGRDPFDDHFFNEPFGGRMFQLGLFGPPTMDPLEQTFPPPLGFIENHHHQPPQPRLSGGAIIEENIVLDDAEEGEVYQDKRVILGKHGRSSSEVETEEAIAEERRITHMQNMNANAMVNNEQWQQQTQERRMTHMQNMNANAMVNNEQWQPQAQGYSFQSATITYGGHDGNYYTSSTTRRTGSDGFTLEESKEANTATREAAHRISRGFYNRGHTVERTLNSDGRVGTNQMLHNLNEDELAGFEQFWSSNAGMQMQFPSLSGSFGSGLVNREQPMLLPPTDPSSSRARGEPYKRRNANDLSRLG